MEAIEAFENFLRDIGMPTRLKEIGVSSDRFEEMAKKCVLSGPIGQFKVLNEEDIIRFISLPLNNCWILVKNFQDYLNIYHFSAIIYDID